MTIDFERTVPGNNTEISVDADGDIMIQIDYQGELTYTLADMREVIEYATKHQKAYQAYRNSDYENEQAYYDIMED